MDVLVVGGSGLLGRRVVRQARIAGHRVVATFHSHAPTATGADWHRLDIRRRDDVIALAQETRPAVIVNAAYRQSDWATTADGATHVALAAAATGARLVHVSSDAVFSGAAAGYDETHPPDPTTPYGAAKAAAETAIKRIAPAAVIARTSLIIGAGDSAHERLVHALIEGAAGVLYTDDVRCPVDASDLATALLELAASQYAGIRHVAGPDALSRYELGVLIARRDGLDPAAIPAGPRPAGPLDLRLDSSVRLRGARDFLAVTASPSTAAAASQTPPNMTR
jgi:dTDP-4-dehydrorhamnose reductase